MADFVLGPLISNILFVIKQEYVKYLFVVYRGQKEFTFLVGLEFNFQYFWKITLASSNTVRNAGVVFDQDISFNAHITQICRTAFFHFHNISKIRNILSQSNAKN